MRINTTIENNHMLTFKYRAYPSKKQVTKLHRQMFLAKKLYNLLLDKCETHYKETSKTFSQFDMNKFITRLKKEQPEFRELHSQTAQNVSKRIAGAYKAFFRRVKERKQGSKVRPGFPRYKKFVSSLTYPQSGFKFNNERHLTLSKVGSIPIVLHRLPKGVMRACFVKVYPSGKWFVGFSSKSPEKTFESNGKDAVGVDVGLTSFVTLSNGEKIEPPKFLRKSESKLKVLRRRVSRKLKGSANRRKARFSLARLAERVSNQRFDFLHKLTRQQVEAYSLIGVENLNVRGMVKNHRLAKSICDASWSSYKQLLAYKAGSAGCKLVQVNPKNTSRTCNNCGEKHDISLSERVFDCPSCGFSADRDVNAAKNILAIATAGLVGSHACGDTAPTHFTRSEQAVSTKQELYDGGERRLEVNVSNAQVPSGSPRINSREDVT